MDKTSHHYFVDRILTNEEWNKIKSLPLELKFKRGDKIGDLLFFGYSSRMKNGLYLVTEEKLTLAREKRSKYQMLKIKTDKKYKENQNKLKQTPEYKRKRVEHNKIYYSEINNKIKRSNYNKNKYKTDIKYRIKILLRNRIRTKLVRKIKYERYSDNLSIKFLIWLAKRNNISILDGKYTIDHIFPLKKLNIISKEEELFANSLYNIQWLLSVDNTIKKDKIPRKEEIETHYKLVNLFAEETNEILPIYNCIPEIYKNLSI